MSKKQQLSQRRHLNHAVNERIYFNLFLGVCFDSILEESVMLKVPIWLAEIRVNDCACMPCRSSTFEMYIRALPCLSMDLASDSEKRAEQWDPVGVALPVNNPSMPLVLSFPAK